MLNKITDNDFKEVIASGLPVVIDFGAEWCGSCRKIAPIVEELAAEYEGAVDIRKCDVEENPEMCERYGILGVPTFVFLKGGKLVEKCVGTMTRAQLAERIERLKR